MPLVGEQVILAVQLAHLDRLGVEHPGVHSLRVWAGQGLSENDKNQRQEPGACWMLPRVPRQAARVEGTGRLHVTS